jgi:hypothetical protein
VTISSRLHRTRRAVRRSHPISAPR